MTLSKSNKVCRPYNHDFKLARTKGRRERYQCTRCKTWSGWQTREAAEPSPYDTLTARTGNVDRASRDLRAKKNAALAVTPEGVETMALMRLKTREDLTLMNANDLRKAAKLCGVVAPRFSKREEVADLLYAALH